MDRRSQQNHIRAARDWLGKAEDSLAQENDVQGDLKLMLAKAELAQVGQSHRSRTLSVWGRRGAAFLVAVALAGGVLWKNCPQPIKVEESSQEVSQQAVASRPVLPTAEPEAAAAAAAPVPADTAPVQSGNEPSVVPQPAPSLKEPVTQPVDVPAPPKTAPQPPNVEKQQLMQSAGKILRQ